MKLIHTLAVLLCFVFSHTTIKAQVKGDISSKYWNFEHGVPSNWHGEGLNISTRHYKVGKHSLEWNWKKGDKIQVNDPSNINIAFGLEKKGDNLLYQEKIGGLMLWIYNEHAIDDYLHVSVGYNDTEGYRFPYYLNFTGWRACWIRFSEMTKSNSAESLNKLTFSAPNKTAKGKLFIDRIMFSEHPIHGRNTPDKQIPFINPKVNHNHWGGQWYWETNYKHDIPLPKEVTQEQSRAFSKIENRTLEMIRGVVPHQDENWYYKDNFADLGIRKEKDGNITGRQIVSSDEYNADLNDVKPLHLSRIFYGLARGYVLTSDDYCREMFFDLFDHFIDQGYDYGSATGTQHHVGYQLEGLPESFLLMKDALEASGRLEKAAQIISYWYGNAECRKDVHVNDLQGVSDFWNTKARGRLIAVLLMKDSPQKVRAMKELSRFVDNSLQFSTGSVGGLTPDGSLFHHAGLYPAYMTGSFMGIAPVIYALSHTSFEIGNQARSNLTQSMLLMRNFSNKYEWPIALSGRQVFAGVISQRTIDGMAYLAKSGINGKKLNKELASAYMRLAKSWEQMYREFADSGIKPEANMDGFQVVNYACLGLHRRDNWLVSIRGYNKFVWSGEIYEHDNRWGRYMSYGSIQVNNQGSPISNIESGYDQNGWDWNRFPGTTTIHLPLDKLYCPVRVLMSRSDETFCGSSSLGKNGIFGMKLHETETLKNFTPDHRARKSVFCFDKVLVSLGSNIENSNKSYPTETTLFQLEAANDSIITIDGAKQEGIFIKYPSTKTSHVIGDNKDNVYYIPKGQDLVVQRQAQISKHNKSERDTYGTFSVAYIQHGKAPRNASYEYSTVINGAKNGFTPNYTVLQKDSRAHIIKDKTTGITGFVLFEPGKVKHNLIKRIDHEALVMTQCEGEALKLSVCSPSVNFASSKQYDDKGSIPVDVTLVMKGHWSLKTAHDNVKVTHPNSNKTILRFTCIDGKTIEVKLNN
ncbi:chondroitinase family polysaccharide lyase [Prolixibacteraceae bacterium]|nr:chondroitinase family polysaccharide lyase [Prolixibacteraceae bacterium]